MSASLMPEEEARYTDVIDGILATADLQTVTRKKIRLGLETALGGKDLSAQKDAIKKLIEQRFDAVSSNDPPVPTVEPSSPRSTPKRRLNGHATDTVKTEYDSDTAQAEDDADADGDEIKVSVQPPKKKQRKEDSVESTEDADAKLAAILQAEENSRTRATRGGGSKPKTTSKKKAQPKKKKSTKKVRQEDDSDVEDGEESGKKRKAGGGFQKPFNLSYQLAELCGEPQLSRPKVVSALWAHIRGNNLQDPGDRRQILCDEKMQAIFKLTKVDMFQMNKLLGNHLYPLDEEV